MSVVDEDKDDNLGFDEFKRWHSKFIDRVIFKYYDTNGDGFIDKKVILHKRILICVSSYNFYNLE